MTTAEPAGRSAGTASTWVIVLAGPVIGYGYFWLVYMLAEVSCSEHLDLVGTRLLTVVIAASAAAVAGSLFLFGWRARRLRGGDGAGDEEPEERGENRRFMARTGLMLLGLFAWFVLLVTSPVIGSTLC